MRWFLLGAGGAGVIAVAITIVVMATTERAPSSSQQEAVNLAGSLSSLDISSFRIPKSYSEVWRERWYPSRNREKRWTWQEVQRFWLDPRKSLLASISEENDKKMQELFKGVR